jgi:serine-type D-Ala-D-Ala carboxypeptidase (penicillin-binding protein 5/6)
LSIFYTQELFLFNSGFSRLKRQIGQISLCLGLSVATAQALAQTSVMPPPPEIGAKGYVLFDLTTGQTLAEFNSKERLEPASLTKLMTAYMTFSALEGKQIKMDQQVPVSPYAWKAEGSRMFIEPNKPVTVEELLYGLIVQSGNDASRALAELLAGDENNFAALMNQQAKRLGLTGTNFRNATGLPDPQHYTTASDLALLAKRIIQDFPEYYTMYSTKEYTYNGIRQPNRNRLLWIDSSVDGMKTGHTESAGYCLVSSANRKLPNGVDRRLLSVVLGTTSDQARTQESLKLMNYGYQMFETVKLYSANQTISTSEVFKGQAKEAKLGVTKDLLINVPRGMAKQLKATVEKKGTLIAPIPAGTELGSLKLTLNNETIGNVPLVALSNIEEAGLFGRLVDSAKLWFEE